MLETDRSECLCTFQAFPNFVQHHAQSTVIARGWGLSEVGLRPSC